MEGGWGNGEMENDYVKGDSVGTTGRGCQQKRKQANILLPKKLYLIQFISRPADEMEGALLFAEEKSGNDAD